MVAHARSILSVCIVFAPFASWIDSTATAEVVFVDHVVDKSPVRPDGYNKSLNDDASFKRPEWADAFHGDPGCDNAPSMWKILREELAKEYEEIEVTEDMRAWACNQFLQGSGYREDSNSWLKTHSKTCFIGLITVFFHLARHRLRVEIDYRSGVSLWTVVEDQAIGLHPSKLDEMNRLNLNQTERGEQMVEEHWQKTGERISDMSFFGLSTPPHWPVSMAEIDTLRREFATASMGRGIDPKWLADEEAAETCCTPWESCNQKEKNRCHSRRMGQRHSGSYNGNLYSVNPDDTVDTDPETGFHYTLSNSFKVFVYDVDDPKYSAELRPLTQGSAFCKQNQWGFEVELHYWFLSCPCRTLDPQEADFFFVPQYTACHLNINTFTEEESNAMFESLIPKLEHFAFPMGGRDHIFVFGGGFAVDGPFRNWRNYIKDSIFMMTETEYWNPYDWQDPVPNFVPTKDIVLPGRIEVVEQWEHHRYGLGSPMESRQYIGDFVGWNRPYHANQNMRELDRMLAKAYLKEARGKQFHLETIPEKEAKAAGDTSQDANKPQKSDWVREKRLQRYLKEHGEQPQFPLSPRQQLLKWAKEHTDMHIMQDVPYAEALKGAVNSRFCFVPRGKSAWSSRLFRVLYARCVPVVLNDDYEIPFADMFGEGNMIPDVPRIDSWIVRWPMRRVDSSFASLLRRVPVDTLNDMVHNAHYVKCWYSWYPAHFDGLYPEIGSPAGNYTNYVCPEWRTKSPYLAVMKLLLRKKRLLFPRMGVKLKDGRSRSRNMMPLSQRIFHFPNPDYTETGETILYSDVDREIIGSGTLERSPD